jgi:hypothetical protein
MKGLAVAISLWSCAPAQDPGLLPVAELAIDESKGYASGAVNTSGRVILVPFGGGSILDASSASAYKYSHPLLRAGAGGGVVVVGFFADSQPLLVSGIKRQLYIPDATRKWKTIDLEERTPLIGSSPGKAPYLWSARARRFVTADEQQLSSPSDSGWSVPVNEAFNGDRTGILIGAFGRGRVAILNPKTLVLTSGSAAFPEWSVKIDTVTTSKITEAHASSEVELSKRTFALLGFQEQIAPTEAAKIARARYLSAGVPRVSSGALLIDEHETTWIFMAGHSYKERLLACVTKGGSAPRFWRLPDRSRRMVAVFKDTLWMLDAAPGRFPSSLVGYRLPSCEVVRE